MICDPLPETGLDADVGLVVLLAIACLVSGAAMLLLARRGEGEAPAILVLLLILGTMTTLTVVGTGTPAQAAAPGCSSSSSVDRLIVTQTSTMVGLAPGVAAAPITGRLENHSEESTLITAVTVEIASITPQAGSSAGPAGSATTG